MGETPLSASCDDPPDPPRTRTKGANPAPGPLHTVVKRAGCASVASFGTTNIAKLLSRRPCCVRRRDGPHSLQRDEGRLVGRGSIRPRRRRQARLTRRTLPSAGATPCACACARRQEDATHSASDGPAQLACLVGDPTGVDCPIVFASEGFEALLPRAHARAPLGLRCARAPSGARAHLGRRSAAFALLGRSCAARAALGRRVVAAWTPPRSGVSVGARAHLRGAGPALGKPSFEGR